MLIYNVDWIILLFKTSTCRHVTLPYEAFRGGTQQYAFSVFREFLEPLRLPTINITAPTH